MQLQLEIWPAADVKFLRDFSSPKITVGRSTDCTLTVASDIVSSQHAEFYSKGDKCYLNDLNSTNGTYVNKVRVAGMTELHVGDEIGLGDGGPMLRIVSFSPNSTEKQTATTPNEPVAHVELLNSREVHDKPVEAEPEQEEVLSATKAPEIVAHADRASPQKAAEPRVKPAVAAPKPAPTADEIPVPFVPGHFEVASAHQGKRGGEAMNSPFNNIPRPSNIVFHLVSLILAMIASVFFAFGYMIYTLQNPARGYTFFGLWFGIFGTLLFFGVVFYFLRKRWGQELLPGTLRNWLRIHFWASLVGFWMILLHAGFNFDGGTGTWALIFASLTVVTGIVGWFFYNRLPLSVYRKVGNLASSDLMEKIKTNREEIEDAVAGKSNELAGFAQYVLAGGAAPTVNLVPSEHEAASHILRMGSECQTWNKRIRKQRLYHFWLRTWLLLHIPLAFAFVGLIVWHAIEATEAESLVFTAGPADYASAESCAECHQSQYNEWIGSMHAIAQSSPVTDLQNRLVLLKEQDDLESGAQKETLVGTLCVRCHAPTGYLGSTRNHEDPLCKIEERSPASQFGVSCVSCHQIDRIHKGDADKDPNNLEYKNIENLEYTQGKLMLGHFGTGGSQDLPSIGNREHRGEFRSHFSDSAFCASCHTVVVDHPSKKDKNGQPERIVKLQDTYTEWLDGGEINWSQNGVQCLDCHGRDLGDLVRKADQMQADRIPLAQRLKLFEKEFVLQQSKPLEDQLAATPQDGFDLKLPKRRKFLHTFSGVDYHLEESLPYPAGHPRESDNPSIQQQTLKHTQDLLKVAAAIRVDNISGDTATVEVLNMGTGHHLPAGFSFAREMWVEVSISAIASGESQDDWTVIIGGDKFKPLKNTVSLDENLNRVELQRLKNFQSVLYSGAPIVGADGKIISHEKGEEVVLQNEAQAVLTGPTANAQGFLDRQKFMLPGEIRKLSIALPSNWDTIAGGRTRRLRVRMLFRNYPPEFIQGIADKFGERKDPENQQRAENLIKNLRIHEMARDTISVP